MGPYFLFIFAFAILLFGVIVPGDLPPLLYFVVATISFLTGLFLFIQLKSFEYGVTTQRIIKKKGLISRNTEEIINKAVETIEVKQGLLGRLFSFGNIIVTGRGNSIVIFESIEDPLKVKKIIESAIFNI